MKAHDLFGVCVRLVGLLLLLESAIYLVWGDAIFLVWHPLKRANGQHIS